MALNIVVLVCELVVVKYGNEARWMLMFGVLLFEKVLEVFRRPWRGMGVVAVLWLIFLNLGHRLNPTPSHMKLRLTTFGGSPEIALTVDRTT